MYDLDEWLKNAQSLHRLFYGKSNIDLNYEMEFTKNVAVRKKDFFSNKEQCGNSDEEPKRSQKGAERKRAILAILAENPTITQTQLMEEMNLTRKQVQKDMKELQNEGLLVREGTNRSGCWVVKRYEEKQ